MILWGGWRDISFGVEVFPGSDARCIETRAVTLHRDAGGLSYGRRGLQPRLRGSALCRARSPNLAVRARALPNYRLLGFFRSRSGEPELRSLGPARGSRLRRNKLPQNLSHRCARSRRHVACLSMQCFVGEDCKGYGFFGIAVFYGEDDGMGEDLG